MPRSTGVRAINGITLAIAGVFLWNSSGVSGHADQETGVGPDTHTLTCSAQRTIGGAIKTLRPGDTLLVSGACNEDVDIGPEVHGITLDGQGTATINGDSSATAVNVRGTGITIRGFTI